MGQLNNVKIFIPDNKYFESEKIVKLALSKRYTNLAKITLMTKERIHKAT